eukprot:CAMPEP_0176086774 /NCGR_PEP_ID=MMETSP0120_2-20121206/43438_1 /TAXON_ID=160619 /ORGANISM="Kryptoperidinium foliaceum, Strain CCMP 1326" /LENGTH=290 /DNA_ID=CAMNT_0017420609 /DNA_START=55 /DNA_END=923 /DNA_ORIENTATION=-
MQMRLLLAFAAIASSKGAVVLRGAAPTSPVGAAVNEPTGVPQPSVKESTHSGPIHAALMQLQAVSKKKFFNVHPVLAQLSSRLAEPISSYLVVEQMPVTPQEQMEMDQAEARQKALFEVLSLASTLIYFGLAYLCAKFWLGQREAAYAVPLEPAAGEDDFKEFRAGICRWYQRPDICIWAWCCPWVRWGDNMWTMGTFRSFWFALVLFFTVHSLVGNTVDGMGIIALSILGAGFRQEMREKFQMARRGGGTYVEDFCLYCWCMCCTVAQEARQVEEAVRAGHPAVTKKAS